MQRDHLSGSLFLCIGVAWIVKILGSIKFFFTTLIWTIIKTNKCWNYLKMPNILFAIGRTSNCVFLGESKIWFLSQSQCSYCRYHDWVQSLQWPISATPVPQHGLDKLIWSCYQINTAQGLFEIPVTRLTPDGTIARESNIYPYYEPSKHLDLDLTYNWQDKSLWNWHAGSLWEHIFGKVLIISFLIIDWMFSFSKLHAEFFHLPILLLLSAKIKAVISYIHPFHKSIVHQIIKNLSGHFNRQANWQSTISCYQLKISKA